MKLPRPYIPLRVRVQVAERQLRECGIGVTVSSDAACFLRKRLDLALRILFGEQKVELHHRPALCNRERVAVQVRNNKVVGFKYKPDANDPDYLVYLPADEHDIETRVRGLHGQHSDLALARKRKRKERKAKRPKYKWPKRKFNQRGKR